MIERFYATVSWRGRRETIEESAVTIVRLLEKLGEQYTHFATWYVQGKAGSAATKTPLIVSVPTVQVILVKNLAKELRAGPTDGFINDTYCGYSLALWDGIQHFLDSAVMYLHTGSYNLRDESLATNTCTISFPKSWTNISATSAASVLDTMIEVFHPDWGKVSADSTASLAQSDSAIRNAGWITYVRDCSQTIRDLVPADRLQNISAGGCLLFATRDVFSSKNPAHLIALTNIAHRLQSFKHC